MGEYFVRYHAKLAAALLQHLALLGITIAVSLALAALLTFLLDRAPRAQTPVLRVLGAVYSVPSLALFAILIPPLGIGLPPAVFVLTLYNQFLLIRSFLAGLSGVDGALIHAAEGMGMTRTQVLLRVKTPLAFPVIMAGIRLAVISTIGIGTIAAVINAGGIGAVLFDGLRTMNSAKIIWGALLAAGLALFANALLGLAERAIRRRIEGR